jgi:hypothetical protein
MFEKARKRMKIVFGKRKLDVALCDSLEDKLTDSFHAPYACELSRNNFRFTG